MAKTENAQTGYAKTQGIINSRFKKMAASVSEHTEAYNELEQAFTQCAFTASCAGTVSALDLAAIVSPDMLVDPYFQAIWRATVELARSGEQPRVDTVFAYIRARQQNSALSRHVWPPDLTPLIVGQMAISIFSTSREAIWNYAYRMRNEALKRQAADSLTNLWKDCYLPGLGCEEIAKGLHDVCESLAGSQKEEANLSALLEKVLASASCSELPLPLPWENLNMVLKGGLAKGELVVLAARPGMGKTALATCIALETARAGIPAIFISREVKDVTLGQRIIARETRLDASVFRYGRAKQFSDRIRAAADALRDLPLKIVEKSLAPMSCVEIGRLARTVQNIGLVVVDYLQLLVPEERSYSREREIAEMSRSMKQLALDLDCPVLLLSQLNRQSEEGNREPRLSDLRESGAIEQDADIVIFLHAEKANLKHVAMPIKALVSKGRSSGTGSANLIFEKQFANFIEDLNPTRWDNKDENSDNGL